MARDDTTAAEGGKSDHDKQRGTVDFAEVLRSEHKTINERRNGKRPHIKPKVPRKSNKDHVRDKDPVYDAIGLALSGGGIRSAAFCLGALQALEAAGALKQVDYLSTVSGGGYIGACWSGFCAHEEKEGLPFPSALKAKEPAALRHIRDHSNYLIPRGLRDVPISLVIYLRGIVANIVLVLPWLLLAAAITIFLNPTRELLGDPLFTSSAPVSIAARLSTWLAQFPITAWLGSVLTQLSITAWLGLALFVALVAWSVSKSSKASERRPEVPGLGSTLLSGFLIALVVIAFCQLQPSAIEGVFAASNGSPAAWGTGFIAASTTFATVVGLFGNKLNWIARQATGNATYRAYANAFMSKALLYAAAAVVPLILWGVYLLLCYWGIADTSAKDPTWPNDFHAPQFMKQLAELLVGSDARYPIAWLYLLIVLILALLSLALKPNANSLHRLYRDRLSNAFLFRRKLPQDSGPYPVTAVSYLPLSKLSHKFSPYHLTNAALNIQNSRQVNQRGRDADFFLFSANYVGSDSTGYIATKDIEPELMPLDLGTAMAISGAAAASNMGANLRQWSTTLALLNVRLGYWFPHPKYVRRNSRWLKFLQTSNLYLLSEMFGLLRESTAYVYLTDGGHIENLGLYQLLRRRCELIIVIDAEADPKMAFNSFIKAERYARIDLGTRIDLPWYKIRDTTLEVNRVIGDKGDTGQLISRGGPHCALGTIHYPKGQEGFLLYFKASLSGDENDYVINYKSRYPSFPHETTGDQFFSEEQFEVYRNLGFHAVQGFFSGHDRGAVTTPKRPRAEKAEGPGSADEVPRPQSKDLRASVQELLKSHATEETLPGIGRR